MDAARWDQLIEDLWRTINDEAAWPLVLAEFAAMTECAKSALVRTSPRLRESRIIHAHGFPSAQLEVFHREFAISNPWTDAAVNRRWTAGEVLATHDLVDDATLRASNFARQCLEPFGDFYGCAVVVHVDAEHTYIILGLRAAAHGPFAERELGLCRSLVAAVGGAVRAGLKLGTLNNRHAALADLADRLPYGIVTVDAESRVIEANELAQRLLAQGDSLVVRRGRLRTRDPRALSQLRHLIASAARAGSTFTGGGSMRVHRIGGPELTVLISPVRRGRADLATSRPAATVLIHDTQQVVNRNVAAMTNLFGLSKAEGRVLGALTQGLSPKEAARDFGVSVFTVRTQIRSLQRKVGSRRASDLIRLTMTLPGLGEADVS